MTEKLERLVSSAKSAILHRLWNASRTVRRQLEEYVLERISSREKRDGTITHTTKPIHSLAFILAYKKLESDGEIEIRRGNIPFPMTDSESMFILKGR